MPSAINSITSGPSATRSHYYFHRCASRPPLGVRAAPYLHLRCSRTSLYLPGALLVLLLASCSRGREIADRDSYGRVINVGVTVTRPANATLTSSSYFRADPPSCRSHGSLHPSLGCARGAINADTAGNPASLALRLIQLGSLCPNSYFPSSQKRRGKTGKSRCSCLGGGD
jgi:hypothetical protein